MRQSIEPDIRWVNHGIGYCNEDSDTKKCIYLNKKLKDYPLLMMEVLKHEVDHYNSKGTWDDIIIDLKDLTNIKKQWQVTKFAIRHPTANLNLMPLKFFKSKRVSVNWFMMAYWFGMVILVFILLIIMYGGR